MLSMGLISMNTYRYFSTSVSILISIRSARLLDEIPCFASLRFTDAPVLVSIPQSPILLAPMPQPRPGFILLPTWVCHKRAGIARFALKLTCFGDLDQSMVQNVTSHFTGYAFSGFRRNIGVTSPDWSNPPFGNYSPRNP